jgi:hypothetical protein
MRYKVTLFGVPRGKSMTLKQIIRYLDDMQWHVLGLGYESVDSKRSKKKAA